MSNYDLNVNRSYSSVPFDNSTSGLGKVKFYESLIISIASNRLVADSLKGKIKEDCDLKPTLFLAIKEEVLDKNIVSGLLDSDEFSLVISRIDYMASQAEETVRDEDFKDSSSNKMVSFVRILGETMLNSLKVLTNSHLSEDEDADESEKVHHIKIQAKNDGYIWLFDMVGKEVDYESTTTYVNGILEPVMNRNATIITAFLKFLAVYKAKEITKKKNNQLS